MKKVSFNKMCGAGNDFVIIDKSINTAFEIEPGLVKKICDRRYGIGADGVVIIADSADNDFEMIYYNADGSTGSLCGNGARCAISYAGSSGRIRGREAKFISGGTNYRGELLEGEKIKFYLNKPSRLKYNFKIKAAGQLINSCYADTGSPHVVIDIKDILRNPSDPSSYYRDIKHLPVNEIGKEIRYSPDFVPGGTNVNFLSYEDGMIQIRTYERGVEDETYACGTGSAAAAVVSYSVGKAEPPVRLKTRGGDELVIDFKVTNNEISEVSLTGPAKNIYSGEFLISKFI